MAVADEGVCFVLVEPGLVAASLAGLRRLTQSQIVEEFEIVGVEGCVKRDPAVALGITGDDPSGKQYRPERPKAPVRNPNERHSPLCLQDSAGAFAADTACDLPEAFPLVVCPA